MNHLWDYTNILSDLTKDSVTITYSSIAYPPKLPLKQSMRRTIVSSDEIYRPDKIAFRLYNNPLLSWILDEANSFYSFSDYTINREIYYPTTEALELMGINYDYSSYKDENFN
jgi:hypothetical protein